MSTVKVLRSIHLSGCAFEDADAEWLQSINKSRSTCREISLIDCGEGFTDIGFCVLYELAFVTEREMISLEISFARPSQRKE